MIVDVCVDVNKGGREIFKKERNKEETKSGEEDLFYFLKMELLGVSQSLLSCREEWGSSRNKMIRFFGVSFLQKQTAWFLLFLLFWIHVDIQRESGFVR